MNYFYLILLVVLNQCNTSVCNDGENEEEEEKQVLQKKFEKLTNHTVYHNWVMPVTTTVNSPIMVNVSIDLYNYAMVDEQSSEYAFHLIIDIEWFDYRLKFETENKDDNVFIEGGQWHIDRVWSPKLFIPNNQNPGSFENQSANLIRIYKNGYVFLRKRAMLQLYCDLDFRKFPFDRQECDLNFESSVFTSDNMLIRWSPLGDFVKKVGFKAVGFKLVDYVTSYGIQTYKDSNFSRISIIFFLEREYLEYLFGIYLPSALIVVTSWTSFWLEITSPPARASIGVTTMLTLITNFKSSRAQLQGSTYWNSLDIWNMCCIVFIFASVAEFALVNYIYNTEKRKRKHKTIKIRKRFQDIRRRSRENVSLFHRLASIVSLESTYSLNDNHSHENSKGTKPFANGIEPANPYKADGYDLTRRRASTVRFAIAPEILTTETEKSQPGLSNKDDKDDKSSEPKMTPQEIANEIDRKCRFMFPVLFIVFNAIYWIILPLRLA